MDILKMTFEAFNRGEFIQFLCGEGKYMVEASQYLPIAEVTDVSKVLTCGIYKAYEKHREIKTIYENSLRLMLDGTDFMVYMVCLYIMSQLFKEKNDLTPFIMDKEILLNRFNEEIIKRKISIMDGIAYPSGYKNARAWEELERFNMVCKNEYHVFLFGI